MSKRGLVVSIVGLFLAAAVIGGVYAQGPSTVPAGTEGGITASGDTINFQGRLYSSAGMPMASVTVNMRFSVCSDASCTGVVWGPTEVANVQTDYGGYFSVLLGGSGTGAAFTANHFTGDRWLRIEVCNTQSQNPCTSGWDVMSPFRPMTSVAIAVGNIRKNLVDTSTANSASSYILTITNNGGGGGLRGLDNAGGTGLRGDGWYGVYGYSGTGGYGVYGTGTSGVWGVEGVSPDSYGVYGVCNGNSYGVYGYSAGTAGIGVVGYNSANVGVWGQTASGEGVHGYASDTTGDVYGVVGHAQSTTYYLPPTGSSGGVVGSVATADDYGVFGINPNTTGQAYGVVGLASTTTINEPTSGSVAVLGSVSRASDYGVWGYNSDTTGGVGTYGYGFTGAVGYSTYARGVFGQTAYTASSLGQAVLGYASAAGVNVHGVYGVAGTASWSVPAAPAGVAGYVNSATGIGVWGGNGTTTGGYGVYGSGYYGVYGYSAYYAGVVGNSTYASGYGVWGVSSGTAGAGVYGRETASGYPNTYGVAGHHYWGGVGVGAWSYSGNIFEGYAGDYPSTANRRLHLTNAGALYVDVGYYTPSALGGVDGQVLAAMMVPENLAEDLGTARLVNGQATVQIAPDFAAVVNLSTEYHVFLTPRGECNGLYVAAAGPTSFEVRELGGGKSNVAFDYRIVAKRQGLEGLRMQPVPETAPTGKDAAPESPPTVGVTTAAGVAPSAIAPTAVTVQQARPVQVHVRPIEPK